MPSYGDSRLFPLPLLSAISNFSRPERERKNRKVRRPIDEGDGSFLPKEK